jgi:hypothetical protein
MERKIRTFRGMPIYLLVSGLLGGMMNNGSLLASIEYELQEISPAIINPIIAAHSSLYMTLWQCFGNANTLKIGTSSESFIFQGGLPLRPNPQSDVIDFFKIFPHILRKHGIFYPTERPYDAYSRGMVLYLKFWKEFFQQQSNNHGLIQAISAYQEQIQMRPINVWKQRRAVEMVLDEFLDPQDDWKIPAVSRYGDIIDQEVEQMLGNLFQTKMLLFYVIIQNMTIENINFGMFSDQNLLRNFARHPLPFRPAPTVGQGLRIDPSKPFTPLPSAASVTSKSVGSPSLMQQKPVLTAWEKFTILHSAAPATLKSAHKGCSPL